MRVVCDTSGLIADLKKFQAEAVRKMEVMVSRFAFNVSLSASRNTPIGDEASLGFSGKYLELYEERFDNFGIAVQVGFHRGAWTYSESPNLAFSTRINPAGSVGDKVYQESLASYRIGETFYIGAKGPGYGALNAGSSAQSPDGIVAPTLAQIQGIYSQNLARYYKEAR